MEAQTDGVSVKVVDGAALNGVECDGTFTLRCAGDFFASGNSRRFFRGMWKGGIGGWIM